MRSTATMTQLLMFAATCTATPLASAATARFIVPAGSGTMSGADWANAMPDLPDSPTCGTAYFLAGGAYDYTARSVAWTVDCSEGSQVYVYKAVDCAATPAPYCGETNPAMVAGWLASYGTSPAVLSQTTDPDPEKPYPAAFALTGGAGYLTIDGVVPLSGTPSKTAAYGIVLRTNNNVNPFVNITVPNVTLRHLEFDGVDPKYGAAVTSCHRTNNVVTVVLASSPPWVVGDGIDTYNVSPDDLTWPATDSVVIASISGNTLTFASQGSDEACVITGDSYVALHYPSSSPPGPLEIGVTGTANIVVADNYLHDFGASAFAIDSCDHCTLERNYVARNHSTPCCHENAVDGTSLQNSTVNANVFEDITGTSIFVPTCGGACNWQNDAFYDNVAFCSSEAVTNAGTPTVNPQCGTSSIVSDDNGANQVTNLLVYGNTFARFQNCYIYILNKASTATVENNLLYCPGGDLNITAGGGSRDYNTALVTSVNNAASPSAHDSYQCYPQDDVACPTATSFADPFVNSGDTNTSFQLSSETVDSHLNDGTRLPAPYNVDFLGIPRGSDGTWERGAYEVCLDGGCVAADAGTGAASPGGTSVPGAGGAGGASPRAPDAGSDAGVESAAKGGSCTCAVGGSARSTVPALGGSVLLVVGTVAAICGRRRSRCA